MNKRKTFHRAKRGCVNKKAVRGNEDIGPLIVCDLTMYFIQGLMHLRSELIMRS